MAECVQARLVAECVQARLVAMCAGPFGGLSVCRPIGGRVQHLVASVYRPVWWPVPLCSQVCTVPFTAECVMCTCLFGDRGCAGLMGAKVYRPIWWWGYLYLSLCDLSRVVVDCGIGSWLCGGGRDSRKAKKLLGCLMMLILLVLVI